MVLDKPIIYYCYDYEEYKKERGMYFDLKDLGLEFCKDIEEIKALLGNESFLNKKTALPILRRDFSRLKMAKAQKELLIFISLTVMMKQGFLRHKKIKLSFYFLLVLLWEMALPQLLKICLQMLIGKNTVFI